MTKQIGENKKKLTRSQVYYHLIGTLVTAGWTADSAVSKAGVVWTSDWRPVWCDRCGSPALAPDPARGPVDFRTKGEDGSIWTAGYGVPGEKVPTIVEGSRALCSACAERSQRAYESMMLADDIQKSINEG